MTEKSLLQRLKKDKEYRWMVIRTAWICCSFVMLGWVESLAGPTFPDLRQVIQEDLDTASWLFTATSCGFLIGSLLLGILYDKVRQDLMLVVSVIGTSLAITAVPWCPKFYIMLAVRLVAGILAASLDTAGNAQVASMWKQEAGPYMQAIHFCFSLGGMISPLMAQPFLASVVCSSVRDDSNASGSRGNVSYLNVDITLTRVQNQSTCSLEETNVQYAYLISGILISMTSFPFVVSLWKGKRVDIYHKKAEMRKEDKTVFKTLSLHVKALILVLLCVLMALYCGIEDTFAGFLMTFLITQLRWTKTNGAFATSVYWICFGVSRLIGIFIVKLAETSTLIFAYSFSLVLSLTGLLVSTMFSIYILIWFFIGLVGCSLSIIFASIFTWTTENVTQVAGKLSAMLMASASFGVILFPLLFGYTMKWLSPMWFVYLLLGQSITWVILFAVTFFITNNLIGISPDTVELNIPEKEPLRKT